MTEQLRHIADHIKTVIRQQPERGLDLLLDFARDYGVDEDVENEVLLLQYDLNASNTDLSRENREGGDDELKKQLTDIVDAIVLNYDKEKVALRLETEKQVANVQLKRPLPNDVVLSADGLQKNYRRSRFALTTNKIELRLGEITGLVGENATGKTTLLKILAGELAPDKGAVHYPLFDPKDRKDWTDLKMRIAYVPQELTPWEGALLENLAFEAARHGIKGQKNKDAVDYIIERLGLALHTDKTWVELSGGYKLRFALAKALVWQPQLLILDEPLAYLDIKTQNIVLADLRHLAKSLKSPIAILISSQHLHETESVADQMWFMRDGTLENLGKTTDFNRDRTYNLFELSCAASFKNLNRALTDWHDVQTWQNDAVYFIKTPLSISGEKLMQQLAQQHIAVRYFRDISQSVKTKFYDDTLV